MSLKNTARIPLRLAAFLGIPLGLLAACANVPRASSPQGLHAFDPQEVLSDSQVEINYTLGHNVPRRMLIEAKDREILASTFVDHRKLAEERIESPRYPEFLQKASDFIAKMTRVPASEGPGCRTPFTITVRVKASIQKLQGCRMSEDGGLSRLVKEGEFLLYSKK
ncbi:MAG: hypothetical protein NDJ89_00290 [Oligoflexia bacterium]|nr:hypothetical protein [Oligoflexia bacterium]